MGDGGDMPGLVGADAYLLNSRRTVRRVIGDQRSGEHHLHRTLRRPCAERGQQGIAAQEQLAAKTTANVGRQHPDILFRDIQR